MNENKLRWRGRLGNSKGIIGFVLLFALVFLIVQVAVRLPSALKNSGGPQALEIEQVVEGAVDAGRYVSVSGVAVYDAGYTETEDGRTVATYYLLLDEYTGYVILVKASAADVTARQPENVTVTGMTRGTPSELRSMIQSDMPDFEEMGLRTIAELYLAEGQKPPTVTGTVLGMVVLGVIAVACIPCLFLPRIVFLPQAVEPTSTLRLGEVQRSGVQATGRFLLLKTLEPTIEFGRRSRGFNNAVANIIPLGQGNLLIYIRHVVRTKLYGVLTIGKRESSWGISITGDRVIDIEPGKLYGWQNRWTLRFRYRGRNDKPQTLFVSFRQPAAQADIVQLLLEMGFAVNTEMAPPLQREPLVTMGESPAQDIKGFLQDLEEGRGALATGAQQHLEKAYAHEHRDEFEKALRECDLAIRLDPRQAEAHNLRGIVLEELGRKPEALVAYREAIRLDPDLHEAQENLADIVAELGVGQAPS